MPEIRKVNDKTITIDDGDITINGEKAGRIEQSYKHGYHIAIALRLNDSDETIWFELDTKNLLDEIFDAIAN